MDEAKLHDFMGKLVGDMGGAAMMANVILGEELGLYRAMADGKPVTPEQLAERTGCNARLVREWLSGQAASGYIEHDQGRFRLPEEQAMALAQRGLAGLRRRRRGRSGQHVPGQGQAGQRDARRRCAVVGRSPSVPVLRHRALLPARLSRQPGQRMAAGARRRGGPARAGRQGRRHRLRPWRVDGDHGPGLSEVDASTASTSTAARSSRRASAPRKPASATGCSSPRRPRADFPGSDFDLVCFFDCLHDMGDPVGAARTRARGAEAGRHGAAGRALRQRRPRPEPQSGRPHVLRGVDLHLHAQLAVAGGRARARRAGRRAPAAAGLRRGGLLQLPPRDRDAVQPRARRRASSACTAGAPSICARCSATRPRTCRTAQPVATPMPTMRASAGNAAWRWCGAAAAAAPHWRHLSASARNAAVRPLARPPQHRRTTTLASGATPPSSSAT